MRIHNVCEDILCAIVARTVEALMVRAHRSTSSSTAKPTLLSFVNLYLTEVEELEDGARKISREFQFELELDVTSLHFECTKRQDLSAVDSLKHALKGCMMHIDNGVGRMTVTLRRFDAIEDIDVYEASAIKAGDKIVATFEMMHKNPVGSEMISRGSYRYN